MKNRDISKTQYLHNLQLEYICAEIRSKIYPHKNDREYFKQIMERKRKIIDSIGEKNSIPNIFFDKDEYLKYWKLIVPEYGLPKFIYNNPTTENKLKFPYKGTAVKATIGDVVYYGLTSYVLFSDNTVHIKVGEKEIIVQYDNVERLSLEATDELFYFYPSTDVKIKGYGSGTIVDYNFQPKTVSVLIDGVISIEDVSNKDISRIL